MCKRKLRLGLFKEDAAREICDACHRKKQNKKRVSVRQRGAGDGASVQQNFEGVVKEIAYKPKAGDVDAMIDYETYMGRWDADIIKNVLTVKEENEGVRFYLVLNINFVRWVLRRPSFGANIRYSFHAPRC